MITKKAGDLLLKIEFSLRVGNGRSRESSVCEDNIIEKNMFNIFTISERIHG